MAATLLVTGREVLLWSVLVSVICCEQGNRERLLCVSTSTLCTRGEGDLLSARVALRNSVTHSRDPVECQYL